MKVSLYHNCLTEQWRIVRTCNPPGTIIDNWHLGNMTGDYCYECKAESPAIIKLAYKLQIHI